MKQYQQLESGHYLIDNMTIPDVEGNLEYEVMMEEVGLGEAEILPIETETLIQVQARMLKTVRYDAHQHIINTYPEWTQRNMLADMITLQDKQISETPLTSDELNRLNTIKASWVWINDVRSESNVMELSITEATTVIDCENISWEFS